MREPLVEHAPVYELVFAPATMAVGDAPLQACIESRTVQRRAMRTTPLDDADRRALEAAVGSEYTLSFLESLGDLFHIGPKLPYGHREIFQGADHDHNLLNGILLAARLAHITLHRY